jgi:hypothetical protein
MMEHRNGQYVVITIMDIFNQKIKKSYITTQFFDFLSKTGKEQ